jgi:hypothetical protein
MYLIIVVIIYVKYGKKVQGREGVTKHKIS